MKCYKYDNDRAYELERRKKVIGSYSEEVGKYYCLEHMPLNEKLIHAGDLKFYFNSEEDDNHECGVCDRTLLPPF